MLGYTAFVVVRFSRRYYLARRESRAFLAGSIRSPEQGHKSLVAELGRGVGTLKAIASAAPFLGLAGTSYGVLAGFYRLGYTKFGGIGWFVANIGSALVAAAAGLMVAIPAAASYNFVRMLLAKFESRRSGTLVAGAPCSYGFAQTLGLRRRFSGFPAFALIAAPVLGILVPMVMLMLRSPISTGLPVHLSKVGAADPDSSRVIIRVISTNRGVPPLLYVSSKETTWDELGNALRGQLKGRPHWIVYVEGASEVAWADVAKAIDVARGLHAEVVLLPVTPDRISSKAPDVRLKRKQRMK